MPIISVAMATYNGEKYIEEQIESILNQTYVDFELIIRDDCSTDSTYKILNEFAIKDRRIVVKRNNINIGFKKNFELLIDDCNGKYIAFADQDDIWEKNHIEILFSIIGNKDVACGNSLLVDQYNNSLGFTMKEVVGMEHEIDSERICWRLFFDNFVQGSAMLVRKELCDKYLPVPNIVKFHDYWLALVASLKNGVAYTPEIILRYRQHGNNVTNNIKSSIVREAYNAINGFNKKHFLRQAEILLCLKKSIGNNQAIEGSYKFYIDCSSKKIDKQDCKYFKEHYSDMFFCNKHYNIRKIIYMYLQF